MNCPSRNDDDLEHEGYNQSPPALAADLTTREDLNGKVNQRTDQDSSKQAKDARNESQTRVITEGRRRSLDRVSLGNFIGNGAIDQAQISKLDVHSTLEHDKSSSNSSHSYVTFQELQPAVEPPKIRRSRNTSEESPSQRSVAPRSRIPKSVGDIRHVLQRFLGFVGPGFIVAVAYIDPGNYSTDVSAGVATEFKLLFVVLMSNIFAIVLQSLAIRLGTVTGLNLAEHCRAHLPWWLNIFLYLLGEAAIIATDIAEVSLP